MPDTLLAPARRADALYGRVKAAAHGIPGTTVGGQVAGNADFVSAVYSNFPLMIALIAVLTFILLARAFRSRQHVGLAALPPTLF